MKRYFENNDIIIPFQSVAFVEIGREKILVAPNKTFTLTNNESYFYVFPMEQLENYKKWLDSQSSYSEIPKSSKLDKKQVAKLMNFFEAPSRCENCYNGINNIKEACKACDEEYNKLLVSDKITNKVNELLEEE